MHRNRTWQIDPEELRTQRNRILPIEGGDGSTLSLDFTTGVLDPRLTFTRSSNATFINSQGYVQFANANLMTYSNPRQTGAAWLTSGTVTWGSSTLTDPTGGSAAQSITFGTTTGAVFNTSGTTVASGITHTFSVWMRSATGTTDVRIGDANVGVVATVTLTTTWQRFSCQYTTSGTNDGGAIYSQTGTPSAEFYVWGAQVQPGSIVGELIQTSGTINTNTPRFDYNPTALSPRGLLIEGSATNYALYSGALYGPGWNPGGTPTITPTGGAVAPDGVSTSTRFVFPPVAGGNPSRTYFSTTYPAGTYPYTVSVWMKSNTAQNYNISILGNTTTNNTVTPVWQRFQVTATAAAPLYGYIYISNESLTDTTDISMWGVQLEAGTGASSYIPTVASTGTRDQDSVTMSDISSLGFDRYQGTFLVRGLQYKRSTTGLYGRMLRLVGAQEPLAMPVDGVTLFGTSRNTADAIIAENTRTNTLLQDYAFGWSLNANNASVGMVVALNGSSVGTARINAGPTAVATSLAFNNNAAANAYASMAIKSVKFWPIAKSVSEMATLTTG
jgi:hypothetical protein